MTERTIYPIRNDGNQKLAFFEVETRIKQKSGEL